MDNHNSLIHHMIVFCSIKFSAIIFFPFPVLRVMMIIYVIILPVYLLLFIVVIIVVIVTFILSFEKLLCR